MRGFRVIYALVGAALVFSGPAAMGDESAYREAKTRALEWLAAQMVPNETVPDPQPGRAHLILSYRVPESDPARAFLAGRSMTYDNALAAIAFTLARDYEKASYILNALSRLTPKDGVLWFGYNTHNDWPSRADSSGALERAGASAWAGYAAVFYLLQRKAEDPAFLENDREARTYLRMARSIATRLQALMVTDEDDLRYGLVTGGKNSYGLRYSSNAVNEAFQEGEIGWASSEHNIDAYFFFRDLGILANDESYSAAAELIKKGLFRLWSSKEAQFFQGVKPKRIDKVLALDCASWGSMFALAVDKPAWASEAIKGIDKKYRSFDAMPGKEGSRVEGYKPYEDAPVFEDASDAVYDFYFKKKGRVTWKELNGVWGEGSLGVALAFLKQGNDAKAREILDEVLALQDPSGGVLYFTRAVPHVFVDYPSVASTAWLAIVLSAVEDPRSSAGFMGSAR